MASLTTLPCKILTFLTELCLESYYDTFIEEGYDNIDFLADVQIEELLEIGMKRGHAKRVIRKINRELVSIPSTSTTTGKTKSNSDQDRRAPSVDPEEEDIDNLPIAQLIPMEEMQDQMEADFNARLEERLAEERLARERMKQEHIARLTDERAAIKKEMERERGAVETQLRGEMKQNEEASQAMIQEMKEEMERKKAIGNYISRGGGRTCACGADISVKPKNYTRCSNCFSSRSSTSSSSSSEYRSASRTCACGDDISDKPKNHTRCSNCFSGRNSTSSSSSGYRSASRTCDCGADISDKPMNHTRCSNCFSSRRSTSNSSNSSSGFGDGGPVTRSVTHCSQSLNKIRGIGPKSVAVLLLLNITTVPELQAKIKIHGAEWLRDNLPFGVNWRKVSQYLSDLY